MIKKFSTLVLAAMIAAPAITASAAPSTGELAAKIDQLTHELMQLKQEMAQVKSDSANTSATLEENSEKWDFASRIQLSGDFRAMVDGVSADTPSAYQALNVARGIEWFTDPATLSPFSGTISNNTHTIAGSQGSTNGTAGLLYGFFLMDPSSPTFNDVSNSAAAAGMQIGNILYGDTSAVTIATDGVGNMTGVTTAAGVTELSSTQKTQNLVALMKTFSAAQRASLFSSMGYNPDAASKYKNDTIWTNRLRINLRAKATENLEFKARLAMYKAWGMQNNPVDYTYNAGNGGGPFMLNSMGFDGNATRTAQDSILRVDRAFMNWNNIADQPIWFSIGRRPTTDGPPAQLRLGTDKKMATPVAFMDYPFDGLSLGYAYQSLFGIQDFPGRVRFCYGRGFESGPTENANGLRDTDFAGLSWDVYHKGNRFFNIQSFAAFDMFNVPDNVTFANPIEFAAWEDDSSEYNPLDTTKNNILDRKNLGNIYHTDAVYMNKVNNLNYFLVGGWSRTDAQSMDEIGTSLLGSWWDTPTDKDGYAIYAGVRYDLPNQPVKLGLEYNHGTKNWISFTPGNDDLYSSKLAARGDVWEAYTIWNIPAGDMTSRFSKAFVRLGAQYYDYEYTGSGFWLGEPHKISELNSDPMSAQFYTPVDTMYNVYLSLEAWF